MKIIKESEQSDKKVTWLRKKIFNLDRLGERERYDTRITDQGIDDTIENHLLRYKDQLAHIYSDPQYLDEDLFQPIKSGIANIVGDKDHEQLSGTVKFIQLGDTVKVIVDLVNLPSSQFLGFHIHEGSACSGDEQDAFKDAKTHFDLHDSKHPEHTGDLPSIYSSNGQIHSEFETDKFNVDDIIGRTIIVHSQRDDFESQPAGDAGDKIACGEILSGDEKNMKIVKEDHSKVVNIDLDKLNERDYSFEYQLLDRLRSDCDYYLGAGNRSDKHLWAGNVDAQIAKMKELWNELPEKPEWLSMEDIEEYERRMKAEDSLQEDKKKKELGAFVKLDAGNVEEGNKFFNKAVQASENSEQGNMSEDLRTINIRDELNKLDTVDYNDLVNMYDCLELSDFEKTQLAQLLSNHDNENVIKFISDRYYKENICEDGVEADKQDIEVSVSLGDRIKQIYDADAEQADIQYENKNYKAWDAFDKKWEPLHLLLVQYDRHNRRPLEKVIDRMRPEDQKQLVDRYLKENLQEQNFDDDMPEWLSRRDRLSKRLSEINQERAEIEKTIDYQQDHNYNMIDFDLMDRLDELNMEAEIINKKLEEI